jgi:hypothetical protein
MEVDSLGAEGEFETAARLAKKGIVMPTEQAIIWQHSNKYSADAACEHCDGIVRHEPWCITRSSDVLYAYEAVLDGDKLTEGDRLILHALGVTWTGKICSGACKSGGAF